MNQELSLWALVAEASITVQRVMFVLFMASVVSWGMIVQRALLLRRAKMQFADFEQTFWSGIDLGQLYRDGSSRLERAMRVALSREIEFLERHLPFLATVGSTSPYVGLFGTVWGIMHSFRGLANMHQATLATVAPGISEALVATAMGLFAAIPAVIAYNRYSAQSDNLIANYETFAEEFSSILHRQAHAGRKSA